MSDIQPQRHEIAPSVLKLLAAFHEETHLKLALAPLDSARIYQRADGSLCEVDEYGWLTDYDELDNADAIRIEPTSVRDTETP